MTRFLAATALSLALATPAWAGPQEDYEALREDVWQNALDRSPSLATEIGDRRGDGKLFDYSEANYDAGLEQTRAFQARLRQIDPGQLPEDLQVDYAIMQRNFSDTLAAAEHDQDRYMLFTNRYGPHSTLLSMAYSSPLFSKADYESYVGRIEAFPAVIDQTIIRTRGALERGLTHACAPMEGYSDRIDASITDAPEDAAVWSAFAAKPETISDTDWTALQDRARIAIAEQAMPALRRFSEFYKAEYADECRDGAPGIGSQPGGMEYYEYLVRSYTTTDMTADEVHQLGQSEVARIRAEMVDVARSAGFDSREDYIAHLRSDPQYYPKTPEELMQHASALAKHIDGFMPKLFGNLPRLPYTVQPIPAATAPGNTTAYYEPGSLATGTPGIYRVNTTELDQRPFFEMPALGVHEAVPGHHLQIAIQQELDIHPLRRHGTFFTAFVEGWGLYSERLGIEMGLYDTPAKQMGRLSYEMWRATRLVVDTGLHAMGWSKQEAVDFMTDNTALSAGNIDAEVNRYITNPGQALAYKLGELRIRELRARAEEALGADFDLRAFHDTVLENGAVPLDVLEQHVDRWIAAQQTA